MSNPHLEVPWLFFGAVAFILWATLIHPNHITQRALVHHSITKSPVRTDTDTIIANKVPQLDPTLRILIASTIDKYSSVNKISPDLIIKVIYKESSFNVIAKSNKDCVGLMQVNPSAHIDKIGSLSSAELYFIDNNIRIGCMILRDCLNSSKSVKKAIRKYEGRK